LALANSCTEEPDALVAHVRIRGGPGWHRTGEPPDDTSAYPTPSEKKPEGQWRAYDYKELVARDKCSLDVFWLKDESLEATQNLTPPADIAREIVEDLRAALEQFESVAADLGE